MHEHDIAGGLKRRSVPAKQSATRALSRAQVRAWILAAQGLPPPARGGKPAAVIARSGFLRTLGGADVYLAARARVQHFERETLDAAVDRGELQVVPAVRGCIYLVPRAEVPLALRIADLLSRRRTEAEHAKAGMRRGEVATLGALVLTALTARGPMTTDTLRRALPDGAVRSLGEAGKKVGISSPLPAALRVLELAGRVERRIETGRLDSERYLWRTARESVLAPADAIDTPSEVHARIAEVFFRAAGAGTVASLAKWAGIPQRDAKAAAESLPLEPIAVDGCPGAHFVLATERQAIEHAAKSAADAIAFLPFEDNVVALHDGPALLVDDAYLGLKVPVWGGGSATTLGEARHMSLRSIVAEGRIVGFWEYDPGPREVVTACFDRVATSTRKKIKATAGEVVDLLRDGIGHGRSYSLDTDAELAKRAATIRALA